MPQNAKSGSHRLRLQVLLFTAAVLFLLFAPDQTQAQKPDSRAVDIARYANDIVLRLKHFQATEATFDSGTDRGGAVIGYREKGDLKCLTFDIGLSSSDNVTRYIFRRGRVVVIDQYSYFFDPLKQTPHPESPRLKARYLLIDAETRYVNHKNEKTYRRATAAELLLIDDLVYNLRRYRNLLSGRQAHPLPQQ